MIVFVAEEEAVLLAATQTGLFVPKTHLLLSSINSQKNFSNHKQPKWTY